MSEFCVAGRNFLPQEIFFFGWIFLPAIQNSLLWNKIPYFDTDFFLPVYFFLWLLFSSCFHFAWTQLNFPCQNGVILTKISCEDPRFLRNQDPRFPVKIPPCIKGDQEMLGKRFYLVVIVNLTLSNSCLICRQFGWNNREFNDRFIDNSRNMQIVDQMEQKDCNLYLVRPPYHPIHSIYSGQPMNKNSPVFTFCDSKISFLDLNIYKKHKINLLAFWSFYCVGWWWFNQKVH